MAQSRHRTDRQDIDFGLVGTTSKSETSGRQHHLISEASPDLDLQGYLDCTVEVRVVHVSRLLKSLTSVGDTQ